MVMLYGLILAVISIIIGLLILFFPSLLRWLIGLYFLVAGIIGLAAAL